MFEYTKVGERVEIIEGKSTKIEVFEKYTCLQTQKEALEAQLAAIQAEIASSL